MGFIKRFWHRLAGHSEKPSYRPVRRKARKPASPPGENELTLADGPPKKTNKRPGAAGIDPYSNDAGYAKPHSWERIDHD